MSTQTPATFGPLLAQYRRAAGVTQETLAERAGVSVRTIQALEHGGTRPHRDTVLRLAVALALDTTQRALLEDAAAPAPRPRSGMPPHATAPAVHRGTLS